MNDFQTKVKILFIDIQIFLFIYIIFYVSGRVFVAYDFFRDYELEIRVILYFSYFLFFNFKQKRSFAMRIFKYHLVVPKNTDKLTMIKYELLSLIDFCFFPVYIILSVFSDKKDRKLLREKFTGINMKII